MVVGFVNLWLVFFNVSILGVSILSDLSGSCKVFYNLVLEILGYLFCYILLVK